MKYRIEKDALGKKKIPLNAYYGIHTQRARENFPISGKTLPLEIFYAIAEIKWAAAEANRQLGLLDRKKTSAIVFAAKQILRGKHDKEFVIDAYQAGAGTPTHMNVNEVIANCASEFLGGKRGEYKKVHPNDDVNMGQSSNNVVPSAIKIVAVTKKEDLINNLKSLQKELNKKAKEFSKINKSARTHLQDAVPITLGQEFGAYKTAIEKDIRKVNLKIEQLKELNAGKNAVGTGINTDSSFTRRIVNNLKKINKITWRAAKDPIYSTQNLTDFLDVSSALRSLAVDLIKIASDFSLLSSGPNTGFGEITLPAVEPGSSIMPGKVNPSIPEMMIMVSYQVIGNDEAICLGVSSGQLDLNVMTPLIAKNLIESITILTNGVREFANRCVRSIKVNRQVCERYFKYSAGVATLLNPYIGYDNAAEVVKESLKTGKSIAEVVLEKKLMKKNRLEKIISR